MGTLRPLFKAFLSRTRSGNSTDKPWSRSRRGNFTKRSNRNVLELCDDFSKSIQVTKTTVINSEAMGDKKSENGSKKSSESKRELKKDSKWSTNLDIDSVEDVGRDIVIEGEGLSDGRGKFS
jgi:hypothetical protein